MLPNAYGYFAWFVTEQNNSPQSSSLWMSFSMVCCNTWWSFFAIFRFWTSRRQHTFFSLCFYWRSTQKFQGSWYLLPSGLNVKTWGKRSRGRPGKTLVLFITRFLKVWRPPMQFVPSFILASGIVEGSLRNRGYLPGVEGCSIQICQQKWRLSAWFKLAAGDGAHFNGDDRVTLERNGGDLTYLVSSSVPSTLGSICCWMTLCIGVVESLPEGAAGWWSS